MGSSVRWDVSGRHIECLCFSSQYVSFYWGKFSSWVTNLTTVPESVTCPLLRATGKAKLLSPLMTSLATGVSTAGP